VKHTLSLTEVDARFDVVLQAEVPRLREQFRSRLNMEAAKIVADLLSSTAIAVRTFRGPDTHFKPEVTLTIETKD
jgi:hypothetical protein